MNMGKVCTGRAETQSEIFLIEKNMRTPSLYVRTVQLVFVRSYSTVVRIYVTQFALTWQWAARRAGHRHVARPSAINYLALLLLVSGSNSSSTMAKGSNPLLAMSAGCIAGKENANKGPEIC